MMLYIEVEVPSLPDGRFAYLVNDPFIYFIYLCSCAFLMPTALLCNSMHHLVSFLICMIL